MTDQEIRLEILKVLTQTASRMDMQKSELVKPGGLAEQFYEFVVKPPTKESTDTPAREPKKK